MGGLLWQSYYVTMQNLQTFPKTTPQFPFQHSRKIYNDEELSPYCKEEKVNRGHSAPHTTTFLISKLKFIEHGVAHKKKNKIACSFQESSHSRWLGRHFLKQPLHSIIWPEVWDPRGKKELPCVDGGIVGRFGGGGPTFRAPRKHQIWPNRQVWKRQGGTGIADRIKCNHEHKGKKRGLEYCFVKAWGA